MRHGGAQPAPRFSAPAHSSGAQVGVGLAIFFGIIIGFLSWMLMGRGMYMESNLGESEQAPEYKLIEKEVVGEEVVNGMQTTKYKTVYQGAFWHYVSCLCSSILWGLSLGTLYFFGLLRID